jgi:hypothetical protein
VDPAPLTFPCTHTSGTSGISVTASVRSRLDIVGALVFVVPVAKKVTLCVTVLPA